MKFKQVLKKELLFYFLTLIVLALIMHVDLLSDPLSRLQTMQEKGNYTHPFLYSFIIYSVIFILRKVIDFIVGLFEKKAH
jgi:hypothetical protein